MKPESHPSLGEVVRWKRPFEKSWRQGWLRSLVSDDVEVANERGLHVIRREYVEIRRYGPRGGARWEKL